MRFHALLGMIVFGAGFACAQQEDPTVQGPVTKFVSQTDFSVDGFKVLVEPKTQFRLCWPDDNCVATKQALTLLLGEDVFVYQEPGSNAAKRVDIYQPAMHDVDATATVEAVTPGAETVVKADGYRIRVGTATKTKFDKPLSGAGDLKPGMVMKYKGALEKDGSVLAKSAEFYIDDISEERLKLRKDWEYDPGAASTHDKQSGMDRLMRGVNASYFPLHADEDVQARVRSIGEKLVPAYAKAMADDDKLRINFRFFVVDAKDAEAIYPLPSGIVLVPFATVQKMSNDSQIAAVLADAIAALIEAQSLSLPMTNGQLTAKALEVVGIGLGGTALAGIPGKVQARRDREQRGRVSLTLMNDAGFDTAEAPVAWWTLLRRADQGTTVDRPPAQVDYLYARLADAEAAAGDGLVGKKR